MPTCDYAAIWDYAQQSVAPTVCPLCGVDNPSQPMTDRYGFAVGLSQCLCGLVYLNPRMDTQGYAAFYRDAYRPLVEQFCAATKGPEADAKALHRGKTIGRTMRRVTTGGHAMLDAGGGVGIVADGIRSVLPYEQITILDPNEAELSHARSRGFTTIAGVLETVTLPVSGYDFIVCALTSDHWLDPILALTALRRALAPGGFLWVNILDSHVVRSRGLLPWKVDHPLYWTAKSFTKALNRTGWTVHSSVLELAASGKVDLMRPAFICQGA